MKAIIEELESRTLPPYIVIDVTNVCNLSCIHCPQSKDAIGREKHFLDVTSVAKITKELTKANLPTLVRVTGDGEPMLHPEIDPLLATLKTCPQAVVNLTTNGILLNPERGERLLEMGLDLIDISLDALTRPTYEIVRRGGNFSRVMRNIFALLSSRDKAKKPLKMMVSFIEQDENAHEREWFDTYWSTVVDYAMIRSLHSASGAVKNDETTRRNHANEKKRTPCPHLWKRLTIGASGEVKFCAHDWSGTSVLGNIHEQSLTEIWQSKALHELRKAHLEGTIPADSPCAKCQDWASTAWDWGYERLVDKVVFGTPTLLCSVKEE
jgi:radical SAM protein with 4Fe4S-binding SPASM domain